MSGNVASRAWPTKRNPDQFGSPSNAAVGSVQSLPIPRDSAASTNAMPILQDAVWRIDALDHQYAGANPKIVRNLGWGGDVLNTRCGSTTVPDSNDPKFLDWAGTNYLYSPDTSGNNATIPHVAGTQYGDTMTWYFDIAPDLWSVGLNPPLAGKGGSLNATDPWQVIINNGQARIYVGDGTTRIAPSVTTTIQTASGVADGERLRLKYEYVRDTGAGQYSFKAWWSKDFATALRSVTTWTQIGSTVTGTSINATTDQNIAVAVQGNGYGGTPLAAKFYQSAFDVDATNVYDVSFTTITSGSATSLTATTGQTVTINRRTSGRKSVAVVAPVWLFGTDDFMDVPTSATGSKALDMNSGETFSAVAVLRHWGTSGSQGIVLSKHASNTAIGYDLYRFADTYVTRIINPDSTQVTATGSTVNAGVMAVIVGSWNRFTNTISTTSNNAVAGTNSIKNIPNASNNVVVRVGDYASAANGLPAELVAVAIFRRPLSAAEISTLTTYYQTRWP